MRKFYCIIFPLFKSRCHWPRPLLWLLPQLPAAKHHGCCSGCCCSSRQQNTMALKDEPSPKYTSCGRNVPSEILQRAAGAESYYNQFFTLLLLRLLNSLLPLLLPHRCCGCCCSSRQQNTMALKDEPNPKCTFPGAETSLLKSYKKLAVGAEITVSHFPLATAAALAAAAAPGSKTSCLQLLGLLLLLVVLLLLLLVVPNGAFWTNKKPAPKCSSHALKAAPQQSPSGRSRNSKTPWPLKDGTTSKNMLPRGLTSLLDSGKNKAIAALATPKHHATEGRNGDCSCWDCCCCSCCCCRSCC